MSTASGFTSGPNELAIDPSKPLSYSNKLLAQVEGIHTDFYTINFARLIGAPLRVEGHGQRLYNSCLTNLPIHVAADDRLQFGWGERSLMRNMGVNLYEYEHLVLASALGECLPEWYAAAVFCELGSHFEDEDRPKPHLSSWLGFVHGANGIISLSDFPLTVAKRIALNPYHQSASGASQIKSSTLVPPEQFAKALYELASLKKGDRESLTLTGGDILGWFAAYAENFLEIPLMVVDKDGKELHKSNNGQSTVLSLTFVPSDTPSGETSSSVVQLHVPQAKATGVSRPVSTVSGRVTGDAMFSQVFGSAFHLLDHAESKPFANALGGLARCWQLSAENEGAPNPSLISISAENKCNPRSYGIGIVQTWTAWFPELRHIQGRMERALKEDQAGASRLCNESIEHLEALCGCYICSEVKGSLAQPTNLPKDGFCIPTLMETIILLGLSLSRVILVANLYPRREGILAMYELQVLKRLDIKKLDRHSNERHDILFGDDWNANFPDRLVSVATLLTGIPPTDDLPENLVAISHQGICAYVLKLERGDSGRAREDDTVIRVVTGSVNFQQKTLTRVCLGPASSANTFEQGWETIQCTHLKEKLYVK